MPRYGLSDRATMVSTLRPGLSAIPAVRKAAVRAGAYIQPALGLSTNHFLACGDATSWTSICRDSGPIWAPSSQGPRPKDRSGPARLLSRDPPTSFSSSMILPRLRPRRRRSHIVGVRPGPCSALANFGLDLAGGDCQPSGQRSPAGPR